MHLNLDVNKNDDNHKHLRFPDDIVFLVDRIEQAIIVGERLKTAVENVKRQSNSRILGFFLDRSCKYQVEFEIRYTDMFKKHGF